MTLTVSLEDKTGSVQASREIIMGFKQAIASLTELLSPSASESNMNASTLFIARASENAVKAQQIEY